MPIDAQGRWGPNFSSKQNELRELCRKHKFVLANGPRYSGKTVGAMGCICEHAWLTDPGNITIITVSQHVGLDSGVWQDLINHALPEWIGHHYDHTEELPHLWVGEDANKKPVEGGNFGMQWVTAPHIAGATKKPVCEVLNQFGHRVTIQLDSLSNEDEVEERFKGRRYSMIYIPELSNFHKRMTFDTLSESLRMIGLAESSHLLLADSNPPDDESWWMHDLWWDLVDWPEEDLDSFCQEHAKDYMGQDGEARMTVDDLRNLRNALARVDITVPDNPFADPKHVSLLRAKYSHNDELYRRYILGECVRTTTDSIFAEVFRPAYHIVGEPPTPMNKEPEMMFPEPDCFELETTWDPGTSTNWAAQIVEKFFPKGPEAEKYKGQPCFKVLDEVMCIGEDVDAYSFVQKVVAKMKWWEDELGREVLWKHWSDSSVFSTKDLESKKFYHQIIHEMSDGLVTLVGAEKGGGSVRSGLDLMRRLLWEERLWFNNATCPVTIAAIKSVKRGKSELAPIQKGSPHKHAIDSLRYLLQSECYDEINRSIMLNLRRRRTEKRKGKSSLVTIPF